MQREVKLRIEATVDDVNGQMAGGITLDLDGNSSDIMAMLYSAMVQDERIPAILNAVTSLYNMKKAADVKGRSPMFIEAMTFLKMMRSDKKYCAEITAAVLLYWEESGVDCDQLKQMVKKVK